MFEQYNDILTPEEAAEILNTSKNRIYALVKQNEINSFKIGRLHKIPRESLEIYVREKAGLNK